MKCDICREAEATVHLTEVVNEKVTKFHICEQCASEKSEEMQSHFGLTDLLSGLMDFEAAIPEGEESKESGMQCSYCGVTYRDFQKTGRLGCGECYRTFAKSLNELLRKIHGSNRHVGKMPYQGEGLIEDHKDFRRLKEELEDLILSEEFEKAALLRDRIKDLKEKLGQSE